VNFFSLLIERPATTIALALAIAAIGASALVTLDERDDPKLGRPAVAITVRCECSLPATVEHEVVRPIERRVAGTKGIFRVEASAQEGMGRVLVYFDSPSDLENALQAIHDSVAAARGDMRKGTGEPTISRVDPGREPAVALYRDGGDDARSTLGSLAWALLGGAALGLVVVLCGTRSWQSTLTALVPVVVSGFAAFATFGPLDLGLAPLTLTGVALAIALLLDDAIVIRESVVRHTELGLGARAAAVRGTASVARVTFIGLLATIALFAPIARTGGIASGWLATLALALMSAAAVSTVISLSLVPALSSRSFGRQISGRRTFAALHRLDCWFDGLTDRVHEMLAWSLDNRLAVATLGLASLAVVVAFQAVLGRTELLPRSVATQSVYSSGTLATKPIQLEVRGPDSRTLFGVAQRIAEEIGDVPGLKDVGLSTRARSDSGGLAQIDHLDGERVIRVQGNVPRRELRSVETDIAARLATIPLPPGYRVVQNGELASQAEVFARLTGALGVGLVVLYLVLAVHFRSVVDPLPIVVAAPVSLVGALLALSVTGSSVNLLSLVGSVLAALLGVRHAIVLVDWARNRRARGVSTRVSFIEAGRARLRPILLSTLALVAAMIPVALVTASTGRPYLSLGAAVVGGTLASIVGTLIGVPVMSAALDAAKERMAAWRSLAKLGSQSLLPASTRARRAANDESARAQARATNA